eukprot:9487853-Pyramimonas_sp.AAC.1
MAARLQDVQALVVIMFSVRELAWVQLPHSLPRLPRVAHRAPRRRSTSAQASRLVRPRAAGGRQALPARECRREPGLGAARVRPAVAGPPR